jgi:hypothetical protein
MRNAPSTTSISSTPTAPSPFVSYNAQPFSVPVHPYATRKANTSGTPTIPSPGMPHGLTATSAATHCWKIELPLGTAIPTADCRNRLSVFIRFIYRVWISIAPSVVLLDQTVVEPHICTPTSVQIAILMAEYNVAITVLQV